MKGITFLAFIWLLVAGASSLKHSEIRAGALYYMSNNEKGNSINALSVNKRGIIAPSQSNIAMTGGLGGRAPSSGLTDALNSQGSLARLGKFLYAVNAGSNTISVLEISPENPLKLTLVGKPISSNGDFPNSIAIHPSLKLACVSNTGTRSGISCYDIADDGSLRFTDKAFRKLTLSPKQSNPPTGPFNTVSQVLFNKDGTVLYATVKGTPGNSTGYLASFPVDTKTGVVSTKQTDSSPAGTLVLFGSVALPRGRLFATDASFGAALLQVAPNGTATVVKKTAIQDNVATCWAAYSDYTGLLYTTDDGINQVVSFEPSTGTEIRRNVLKNGNPEMIEIIAVGKLLYALSHGNSTYTQHVVALKPEKDGRVMTLQNFKLDGVSTNVEGLVFSPR